ncbi:reverse transcriptase [Gossypium australe]|uniref:Reverse transcriptase n=1 Tax=Gossypium australe TaxID=47621 RepID=A0A5B6VXD6_9ROSI|nr:reverse transcriptase [Gossypium australe]
MVCFSPNTPVSQRAVAMELLNMKVVNSLDSYLGLSILVGRKKSNAFKSILNYIVNRINSWSKRLLSSRGKEIFVKLVIQSIPTCAFTVFLALKDVLKGLQSMIECVWWGGGEKSRGWSMLAWDRMCHPKVWRLINCKDTLCYKVLRAKYFPNGDVFHPRKINKPFFTWQSIAKAASTLSEGFGWNVGNGRSVDIWNDNWGFEGLSGSSIRLGEAWCMRIKENKDGWKEDRILELYGESMRDQICKMPILHNSHADQRIWFHNPCGFFSTKTAYSWLILKQKLGHDNLPTYDKIASIRDGFNSTCPRCENERETLIHVMKDCPKVRAVLEHGGFNNRLLNEKFTRCID